ncbi:MAG: hypothetical protein ACLT5V_07630 [Enterococcus avium]
MKAKEKALSQQVLADRDIGNQVGIKPIFFCLIISKMRGFY